MNAGENYRTDIAKDNEFLRKEIARLNQRMMLLQKDNDNLYAETLRLRKELQNAAREQ